MSTALAQNPPAEKVGSALAGKYLSFRLSKEEYAIHILKVREIIGVVLITPLPHTPPYVRGVINLRGKIIPVIDLRLRFGMERAESTPETCIVVVDVERSDGQRTQMGCIVDSVSEVLNVETSQIEPAPRCGQAGNGAILGLGKLKERVLILLDIDKVMAAVQVVEQERSGLAATPHVS